MEEVRKREVMHSLEARFSQLVEESDAVEVAGKLVDLTLSR
jgi:hypothetical protein